IGVGAGHDGGGNGERFLSLVTEHADGHGADNSDAHHQQRVLDHGLALARSPDWLPQHRNTPCRTRTAAHQSLMPMWTTADPGISLLTLSQPLLLRLNLNFTEI